VNRLLNTFAADGGSIHLRHRRRMPEPLV